MTLRTKPGITVSVTKKPDGRLVLNYTRRESTAAPSSGERAEEASAANPVDDPQDRQDQGT
jgi:hypothetical protein